MNVVNPEMFFLCVHIQLLYFFLKFHFITCFFQCRGEPNFSYSACTRQESAVLQNLITELNVIVSFSCSIHSRYIAFLSLHLASCSEGRGQKMIYPCCVLFHPALPVSDLCLMMECVVCFVITYTDVM